jgi:ABC-2 type transport system permease protein
MILLLVLGMSMFHLWLMPHPLLIPLMLLSPLALSGIGATIGVLAPNQQVAGVTANLTMVVVMFLSPVFARPSRLPGLLQLTSRLLPPTYTADGLRQTLAGQVTASVGLDLLVLTLFSVAGIYLVTTRLDWRSR